MTYLKKYVFQIKQKILNLIVFIIITGINEPKTLTKHVLCECKCKFDGIKCKSNQWWNNDRCRCECKKFIYVKKIIFRIMCAIAEIEKNYQALWMIQMLYLIKL